MTSLLGVIQIYPALGKLATDVSSYWWGVDPSARERILQHKVHETQEKLDDLIKLVEKLYNRGLTVEVGTQTE